MDKLPVELVIDVLVGLEHSEILNTISANKRIYDIYNNNKELIYRRKIENEFKIVENEEDLYFVLYNSQREYELLCKEKEFYKNEECINISRYIKWIYSEVKNNEKKIKLIMKLFEYIDKCYDVIIKEDNRLIETLKRTLTRLNVEINKMPNLPDKLKGRWDKFYETTGRKILKRI
jgi:hypothetical protein